MNRFTSLLATSLFASTLCAIAQNAPPVVASQIGDFTEYAGAPLRSIRIVDRILGP
jgi:hypothetical protein